ncbi:tetraacyldisaccharide 4'-kinase [Desulfurobacterium thermolithotrophum]|uniref:tetraacyldisaccharide 4'-kinase n=1 Tax=Desulfurobacterium thermolithotrophum TaxID=64160 RepID=UPI0013D865EF|nr:tetraacyldisaccharide 4'-kinase [Desulfurobacterium thermolithotrophum]
MNLNKLRLKALRKEGIGVFLFPVLWSLSKLYCFGAEVRNFLYSNGFLESKAFPFPVISVGNIVAGGSGKTPLTESIYLILEEMGFSPAIVSRGYKGKEKGPAFATDNVELFGDEASLYAVKGYKTIVSKNKLKGIEYAFLKGANVVILDDGFQYRKLLPKINIAVIDPFNPFGDNYCLPLGLLREAPKNLERADCFVITRSNLIDSKRLNSLELYLRSFRKPIFFAEQVFKFWINESFERTEPPEKEIDVFCGIGNPSQFVEMLINMGYKIRNYVIYDDHHAYTQDDIKELKRFKNLVTTEKDLIKLRKSGLRLKAPVIRFDAYGLKEYLSSNIENTEKLEEEVERGFIPSGISTFKGESFFNKENW